MRPDTSHGQVMFWPCFGDDLALNRLPREITKIHVNMHNLHSLHDLLNKRSDDYIARCVIVGENERKRERG